MAGYDELRREQAEKRERGELMGIGVGVLHRGRRRRAAQAHGHPRASAWPTAPSCACTRPARRVLGDQLPDAGPGPRDDVRADRRRGARDPARGHRGGARRHRPHAVRPRHVRQSRSTPVTGAATALVARKVREQARIVASAMLEVSPDDLEWEKGRFFVKGDPEKGSDDPGDRDGRARNARAARGRRGRSRRRDRATTRRTSPSRSAPTSASSTSTRARPSSRCGDSSPSTTAARGSTR